MEATRARRLKMAFTGSASITSSRSPPPQTSRPGAVMERLGMTHDPTEDLDHPRFPPTRRSLWLTVAFYAPASLMLDSGNPLFDVLDRAVDRRLDRPAAESRSQNERGKSRLRREGCPSTWRPTVTRPA